MDIAIEPITPQYIESFAGAVGSVARELRFLAFTDAPPLDSTVAYVLGNIEGGWPHFVARHGDSVIGWCDISPLNRPVFAHAGVLGIGLIDGYRGQGIGPRLLTAALDAARQRGLERIELTVREPNLKAIRLYERFGFVREGLHIKALKLGNSYENILSMALLL